MSRLWTNGTDRPAAKDELFLQQVLKVENNK